MKTQCLSLLVCVFGLIIGAAPAQESTSHPPLIRGVSYVGLAVSDLDKAVEFYSGACDLTVIEEKQLSDLPVLDKLAGRPGVKIETKMLEGHNAQLRLMKFETISEAAKATPPVPVVGPGYMHVCFQVLDELRTYQRVLDAGATPIGDSEMAQLNPNLPVYYAYVHDFDRRVIEIEHIRPRVPNARRRKVDHRLRHICISTPNIEPLLEFYSAFLNGAPRRVGPISGERFDSVSGRDGTHITMAWYPIGTFELEINQYLSHPTQHRESPRPVDALGYNMTVFDVSDLPAAAEKLVASGGIIITEPAAMDGGEIVFARDPDGNLLGLLKAPDDAIVSSSRFASR